jgi:hypothetical protein
MRTKELLVSDDTIVEFSELLEENNLKGTILGVSEDSEIKVHVTYERENRDVILDLMELVDGSEDDDDED